MCSGMLHLLDWPLSPALPLAAALGWRGPPRASVVVAQLLALGSMHAVQMELEVSTLCNALPVRCCECLLATAEYEW